MSLKRSLTLGVFIAVAFHCSSTNAYGVRSGYARPAELESAAPSGAAFGTSESSYGQAAQSYVRPAAVSTGYQPSISAGVGGSGAATGGAAAGGYEYGGGSYPSTQTAGYTPGNGKRKPFGLTSASTGNGYGGGYAPSSGLTDTGTYGGGATTGAGYTRPASVPYTNGAAPSVPLVSTGGAQYPSYPADTYESGAGAVPRPYEVSSAHVPSAGVANGCAGQERPANGGCTSAGGGAQFPSRPVEPYDVSVSTLATAAPYDSSYGTTSAHTAPRQPNGGGCPGGVQPQQPSGGCPSSGGAAQYGGNGHATGQYGGGAVPSTYEESGYDSRGAAATGCAGGGGGEQAAAGGCEQAAGGRPSVGMPNAPSTTFTRPSGFGGGSGQAASSTYSDYGSSGYAQQRTDDAYRGAAPAPAPAPAYPSTVTEYSPPAATYNGGHANGNGYYDSSKAKDYGGAVAAPSSYARPAEGAGYATTYGERSNGWHARDSYPAQATSYSRPSGLAGGTSAVNGYARPSYDANGYGNGYATSYAKSKM